MATFSVLLFTTSPASGGDPDGAYVKIDGREALLRSVELFLNRPQIKQIQIAFAPEKLEEAKRKYGGHLSFSGVKVVSGGPRWLDQIAAGAAKLFNDCTHVIIHDAARPAVAHADIEALMEAADKKMVVSLVTPVRNLLSEVDEGGNPLAFAQPGSFMQILTPQVIAVSKFKEMAASKQELHASAYTFIKGSPLNIRVDGSSDASLVKAMIAMLPKPKIKAPSSPFEEAQW